MNRLLRPILLCLLVALALGVAACGGSDGGGKEASSDTDVDTLLADTFNGKDKKVESGKLDLSLKIDAKNTEGVSGPVTVSVKGPFQTEGKQKLPKFDIDFAFEGAGQSIKAGLTSTGTRASSTSRAPTTPSRTRSSSSSRPATSRPRRRATRRTSRSPRSASTRASGSRTPRTRVTRRSATTT